MGNREEMKASPLIGVVMGSDSDLPVLASLSSWRHGEYPLRFRFYQPTGHQGSGRFARLLRRGA